MAARLTPSWNAPSATAPSPKKQATTLGSFCILNASAMPAASGMPPADDRDARHHPLVHVADVHRPALALAAAGRRAEELEEQLLDRQPLGQRMAVAAEGRGDEVALLERRADADGRGLLALALVDRAGHRAFQEQELHPLLELADQDHPLVEAEQEGASLESPEFGAGRVEWLLHHRAASVQTSFRCEQLAVRIDQVDSSSRTIAPRNSAAYLPLATRWSTESVRFTRFWTATWPSTTVTTGMTLPTARIADSGGLITAANDSTPEPPRFETVNDAACAQPGPGIARAEPRDAFGDLPGDRLGRLAPRDVRSRA